MGRPKKKLDKLQVDRAEKAKSQSDIRPKTRPKTQPQNQPQSQITSQPAVPTIQSLYDRSSKRGRISREEDKRIAEFVKDNLTHREMAHLLKRSVSQIENYVTKYYGNKEEVPSQVGAEFLRHLRNSDHWKFLQQQYTREELNYYESLYAKVMAQFHEDILPTEELQVLQALDAVILVNRHKKSRKTVEDRLTELDLLIQVNKIESEDNEQLQEKILAWESQRQLLFSQANARTKDFTELTKKFDETIGKLKGTREQRIKNVESSRQSWTSLIKTLQDRKVREKEGRHMEMFRLATNKAEASLRDPHRYFDDKIDQPLLSVEDVRIQTLEELSDELAEETALASQELEDAVEDVVEAANT